MTVFPAKWDAKGLFADDVASYDSTVDWVVPHYRTMHGLMLKLAVQSSLSSDDALGRPLVALDIGSGTGAEAIPLLQAIPQLSLVGVDFSEQMNKAFALRAARSDITAERFQIIQADIMDPSMRVAIPNAASAAYGAAKFRLVTSAFTFHHFPVEQKAAVFRLIYDLLEPGGIFLLGDLFNFAAESPWLTKTISDWETRWFSKNFDEGSKSALERGDPNTADACKKLRDKWLRHYVEEHALDSVTSQLNLLKYVGFQEAGNPFRYWQVGLILAKKTGYQDADS